MKTVKEVSELTGVSVRALHHYDQLGLLKPAQTTAAGYRLYGDAELRRLQQILFFRELDFPLRDIAALLDSPHYDAHEALSQQRQLLKMKRDRLSGLIAQLDALEKKGENDMEFKAFDHTELDTYAKEAKQRWGDTPAYHAYEDAAAKQTDGEQQTAADGLLAQFAAFAALRGQATDTPQAQAAVAALQAYITAHFYPCSNEILASLGQMYTADERFRENIDRHGDGTADFASAAIAAYCAAK